MAENAGFLSLPFFKERKKEKQYLLSFPQTHKKLQKTTTVYVDAGSYICMKYFQCCYCKNTRSFCQALFESHTCYSEENS